MEAPRLDRRQAIAWMLAAAGSAALWDPRRAAAKAPSGQGLGRDVTPYPGFLAGKGGYGMDPDLLKDVKPGELWPLTFTAEERRGASALCDLILPADAHSPSASAVGVPDFLDEWISAPYPVQEKDRGVVRSGLAWLDGEARRRFGSDFAGLVHSQQTAIADDICHEPEAGPEFKEAARFFQLFRDLAMGGFYTSPEGVRDIGYIGNVPLASFDGPTPEALRQLGLDPNLS